MALGGAFIAVAVGYAFVSIHGDDAEQLTARKKQRPLYDPLLLPIMVLIFLPLMLWGKGALWTAAWLAGVFLYLSVYFALLLALLPLLRRQISARACAALWLLPNILYVFLGWNTNGNIHARWAIPLPSSWLRPLFAVWAAGALVSLGWQLGSHLAFRKRLLRVVHEPTAEVAALWETEQKRMWVKKPYTLLTAPAVSAPLSIGLFRRTVRVLLPERAYSEEELRLIFRHELWHLQHRDIGTKAFLGFCAALCWFNPLLYWSRRKAAEDLELGCDEAVLAAEDEGTRRRYAALILDAAADSRGFTTCLSARAESLRYRLKAIVHPRKRRLGAVAVGLASFALFVCYGLVALSDAPESLGDLLTAENPVTAVSVYSWPRLHTASDVYAYDEDALLDYMGTLRFRRLYYGTVDEGDGPELSFYYTDEESGDRYRLTFRGQTLALWQLGQGTATCIVDDAIDWDYLDSLLDFDAPNPGPAPQPPEP